MALTFNGCKIAPGSTRGEVLATAEPISFWGGVDPKTGCIIDPRHELFGREVCGKVLAFPYGKGSSTTSLIILELLRVGKAPAAIINVHTEPILATGPVVSRIFYGQGIPMITLAQKDFERLKTGQHVVVDADRGTVQIERQGVLARHQQ
jgi:predicted aconitase with swiveling domain